MRACTQLRRSLRAVSHSDARFDARLHAAADIAARYSSAEETDPVHGRLVQAVSKALLPMEHALRQASAQAALTETLRQATEAPAAT
ncbi:hypothetical protein ACIPSE_46600 [Streptomyces sp. NPDC090106]|uniref:hypothetical protein n=1 Tax=Streptomyces sp. NPDC090106 TaxID=3365946 RepID=UPI0037F454F5